MLLPLGAVLARPAAAHGPSRLKVTQKIGIEAPADKVWALIRRYDALKDWHPAVASSPADKGEAEGSVRIVTLKGGGTITEVLERHDDAKRLYAYRVRDGGDALPVTNYASTLLVTPDGDARCTVEWRGAFYRGYPNNDPPPEKNDDAAEKAVNAVYASGLANLKKLAEAR
ncbi:MxaD protein [Piscinibacter sakaiensis]|uniref:MxaD protein n=1 Tax=Piscinibacter sakaiensis TaxID=1547922 RepID=A0A0K8P8M7_PISS1|nr:MxaD protein [Piscinibacter sakaiensis]